MRFFTKSKRVTSEESPPQVTSQSEKANNFLAAVSGVSVIVLQTLQSAARFAPVPYLSDISAAALGIVNAAQTFESNKEGFRRLAADSCELVYAVTSTCDGFTKDGKSLPADLEEHLKQLLESLKKIQAFIAKQSRRNRFSRFLTYKTDTGTIQEYREALRHSLDLFGLQSDITIRETVQRIAERQEELRASNSSQQEVFQSGSEPVQRPRVLAYNSIFSGVNSGTFSGNIRVNNVVGDQNNSSSNKQSVVNYSYNSGRGSG
ncbi:hypothetical protein E1B28_011213 [Marasmius oreades]|uniref:Uncharacterized protein n=1 Tax=Marasmius oreades TaxID=181124 RepID=A0A9P7UPZ3_9AGAR|nr:uncharacterized protein E1B28_011213 [Marasmius oreades]KAG7089540.1 hypothetical protein E1B28_011213 [Marasmius oreades]